MTSLLHWATLFILAPNLAWAQSAGSATAQQNGSHAAISPGTVSTSDAAATLQPTVADSTALEVLHSQRADYPLAAERDGLQGEVLVKVSISETGDVAKTEILSGDPVLADAAIRAAKKFKFKPFIKNGKPVKVSTQLPFDFYFLDKVLKTSALGEKAQVTRTNSVPNSPANSMPGTSPNADASKRVQVDAILTAGRLIRKIQPVYPPEAKQSRIQGTVLLRAMIGKDGRIKDLKAVSGPKELLAASIGAVQQWVYVPYLISGEPVEVDTEIKVNFILPF